MGDTLTTLQVQVRNYLREPSGTVGQLWTDTIVNQGINQALRQIEDMALEYGPWYLEYKATQNIVSGTYAYTFPSVGTGLFLRQLREIAVYAVGDDTTYPPRPLSEISLQQGHEFISAPLRSSGIPSVFYRTSQNTIEIYPKPNYALTNGLVWQVYRSLTVLATGSDANPLPDGDTYSELIIWGAFLKLIPMDEDAPPARTQNIQSMYNIRAKEFIMFLQKSRRTRPSAIQIRGY